MTFCRSAIIVFLAFALSACTSLRENHCNSGEHPAIQESLYFGTAQPDGLVSPEEWSGFLGTTITPRFPEGLTVFQASGQWRDCPRINLRAHPDPSRRLGERETRHGDCRLIQKTISAKSSSLGEIRCLSVVSGCTATLNPTGYDWTPNTAATQMWGGVAVSLYNCRHGRPGLRGHGSTF